MRKIVFIALFILLFTGCSINKIVINRAASMIENGLSAIYEEEDLPLAQSSLESNLKLLEVLLKNNPDNETLKLILSQGYGAYSLAFLEDDELTRERARFFYLRGRDYAMDVLMKNEKFREGLKKPVDEFKESLQTLDRKWVPALFWCGFNWGGYIQLSLNNPKAIFDLAKVEAIMERVRELDEAYYFAGVHLFFGSIAGAKPRLLGGNPEKAREHFERALELTEGKFLLTYVYYAKFFAIQTLDEETFDQLLQKVEEADLSILPEFKLINVVAKKKAALLKSQKNEIF
ncbi:MAG: hypothetical protein Kow00108_10070 [Calditrichia bacterium]